MSKRSIPKIIATLLVLLLSLPVKAQSYDMSKVIAAEYAINSNNVELAKKLYTELYNSTESASVAKQLTYIHLSQSNIKAAYPTAKKWSALAKSDKEAQSISAYLAIKTNDLNLAKNKILLILNLILSLIC